MKKFTDIEEILETNEVEIISDKETVTPKKKKAVVNNTTTKKIKTSANMVLVSKCPKKTPATKKTGPSTLHSPYGTHKSNTEKPS